MARQQINRSGEMAVFVRAVELGGFSAAARECGMTPSAVSKLVQRLEERLGVRLINRSTRQLQLTPEGCAFHERAASILADIDDAERQAAAGDTPAGRVRLNASASFATHVLMPLLPDLLGSFPELAVDIIQTDAVVDLMAERVDIAIRAGPLKSSTLIARKLGSTSMTIVGAPSYLECQGKPESLDDLRTHNRLSLNYARAVDGWPVLENGLPVQLPPSERVRVSDGEGLRRLALAGVGLARMATFTVRDDIAAGRLVPIAEHLNPGDRETFHAVFQGQGGTLPSRVRVMLDFLAARARLSD
ncbi:LysR family transcriptional regulator [Sinorhizobium sp. RAC02]|uniref:LysR family transcriptional regulator n=1 Tax=Sinorhizobium sp. RAC02 TaxID=1842534 RepID=UPI00083D1EBF|nr:LysR family transcriptional regulator [Sinorhizobium sp. RAC02]AOF92770.1 bacterial regulatory helix-turn-helix, lysR family protein [Sinorhizobium sp. RAC02]